VLINPDEWAHLMAKAGIPDSSFAKTLTTSFYHRRHTVTLGGQGGGRDLDIPFALSFIGGIVEEEFDTVFNASSLGGLYDRFLFGLIPEGFKWSYRAFPHDHPIFENGYLPIKPVSVTVDGSVYEVIKEWNRDPALGRVVEICTRVATIFASIDGRDIITGADLEAMKLLADNQQAIRGKYRPNPGENHDAIFANTIMNWVKTHAQQWRSLRELQQGTNYHRSKLGPSVAFRALKALAGERQIELWTSEVTNNGALNPLPADYTGKRPKIGSGLVRVSHD
jgi:hypothetical protein